MASNLKTTMEFCGKNYKKEVERAKAFVEQSEEDMSPEDLLNKRVNETLAKKNNPQSQENTESAEDLYDAIEQDGE